MQLNSKENKLIENYSESLKEQRKLILVGNPNVGKSVIFSYLTNRYVIVSNYPGTTVEFTHGIAMLGKNRFLVYDTPGINSLIPMYEDERVTLSIIMR